MPKNPQSPYKAKVNNILMYIKNHLSEEMTLDSLAKLVNLSPFHFHRIYSSIAGETVYDSILRLRMEHAIIKLSKNPSIPIIEIAFDVGFQNPSSFTRAFKRYFGFTPSDVQQKKINKNSKIGTLKSKYGKELTIQDLYPEDTFNKKGEREMNVEIKNFDERPAISLQSSYAHEEAMGNWLKLRKWYEENKGTNVSKWDTIGLYQNDPGVTPLDKCRAELCLYTDKPIDIKAPFKKTSIPAGRYAVARYTAKPEHRGKGANDDSEAKDMLNFIQSFYKNWLTESGYEADNYPLMMSHHIVKDTPCQAPDGSTYFDVDYVDIMIKLKS